MDSIWNNVQLPTFGPLHGDVNTDVLVVGGGMAGILCAYFLKEAGAEYMLIEADRLAGGVTGCTTAKITSQHGLKYDKLIRRVGREKAKLYLDSQQSALNEYRRLCQSIDCDFEKKDAFVYSRDNLPKLTKELEALQSLGFSGELVRDLPLPFPVAGAVRFPDQAQFHPLKFLAAISTGLNIFESTRLLELAPGKAVTDRGVIKAKKVIIATHFPILNKHGAYFLKQYQSRSYVLALKQAGNVGGMYIDEKDNGLSFRNWGDFLLLGGGGHRTGKQGGGWKELTRFAGEHYPNAYECGRWATQDCMTLDGVPYVGQYGKKAPELYVATGFGKWGMTSSMAAAMLLRDLVLDIPNPVRDLYDPARTMLHPQLALNALEAVVNLMTPTRPRCPHMGCALKWNSQEHTWDCPCHGSRFTDDGKLLDGPATDDKRM